MALDLDDWLPDAQIRTRHRRAAAVEPDRLWAAAQDVHVRDAPVLGRVVRWRLPGTPPDVTFRELFGNYPFVVLDRGERWSISGLCGRVWTVQRDYPRITGADEFRAWRESGTVRVVFANWVEPDGKGGAALVSESRIEPVDRRAALRTRALWTVVGRFERLIGVEALRAAVRFAERG
ncbi:MAG: hypothetical protein JWN32_585 [Solirubrobacterales bacterium]|nr:hypothetical protein [Solirubrobacterales bacterium]